MMGDVDEFVDEFHRSHGAPPTANYGNCAGHTLRGKRCRQWASVEVDGQPYCKAHAPNQVDE